MAQSASSRSRDPPAKKIGPEVIDPLFDQREVLNYPVFTAGKIADILVDELDELDELNPETVRNHLNEMVESDVWDVEKYTLGARTVVYARKADPAKVSDGGVWEGRDKFARNVLRLLRLQNFEWALFDRWQRRVSDAIALLALVVVGGTFVFGASRGLIGLVGLLALLAVVFREQLALLLTVAGWRLFDVRLDVDRFLEEFGES